MEPGAVARGAARYVLDFALPPRCPGCGQIVEDPHRFCLACWQSLDWLTDPCCVRCGLPFTFDRGDGLECGGCLADPPRYDRMRAAVAYGEVARRVVLKLKYGGKPGVAATLALFMQRHLPVLGQNPILIPVPLHRWRIWRRGYNQSALIARALARASGYDLELDLLRRVKRTPLLRGLGRSERRRVLSGAFAVPDANRGRIRGRAILLVDDVCTSGATANACASVLKRAGAETVNLLCWARVLSGESVDNEADRSQVPVHGVI